MRIAIRKGITGTTWVAVCNECRAQVYEWVRPEGPLLQLQVLVHTESRCRNLETPKEVEQQIFAREVAGFLSNRAQRGEFGGLVLAAPPRFLGLLRQLLCDLPQYLAVKTVEKDLTAVKPYELIMALEEALPPSPS